MKRMLGFLMMVGLMVGFVGCGDDESSPTGTSSAMTCEEVMAAPLSSLSGDDKVYRRLCENM